MESNEVSVDLRILSPGLLEEPALPSGSHAMALFMNVFVWPTRLKHHVRSIPILMKQFLGLKKPNSLVYHCVQAASLAALALESQSPTVRAEATQGYVRALQLLRSRYLTSNSPEAALEVLMTPSIFLLIESISLSVNSSTAFYSHGAGALAYIRSRYDYFKGKPGVSVSYRGALHLKIKECLYNCRSYEPDESDQDELNGACQALCSTDGYARLTRIFSQVPSLHARAKGLLGRQRLQDGLASELRIRKLLDDTRNVDSELCNWYWQQCESRLPNPRPHPPAPGSSLHGVADADADAVKFEPSLEDSSSESYDAVAAFHLNEYRMFCIYTQSIILKCLDYLGPRDRFIMQGGCEAEQAEHGTRAQLQLQRLVDGIAASARSRIAVASGHGSIKDYSGMHCAHAVTGFVLVEHVSVAASVASIADQQREWLERTLQDIKNLYGFKHTFSFVPP